MFYKLHTTIFFTISKAKNNQIKYCAVSPLYSMWPDAIYTEEPILPHQERERER